MKSYAESLPSALSLPEYLSENSNKYQPAIFLDYDGTLTPIVDDPNKATLDPKMQQVVDDLSKVCLVGIISGRDRADVQNKVALPSLIYAGSHGYDIAGPDLEMAHEKGVECLPSLDAAEEELKKLFAEVDGARVERKKFAIAVHYRHVNKENVPEVLKTIDCILKKNPCLKAGPGKMIMELKPNFDWNKGKALWYLIDKVATADNIYPIYVGDDMTDEDAFKTLTDRGTGVLVGDHGKETAAGYKLNNTDEVYDFLVALLDVLKN
ncbi:trehalose-phosphatase [Cytophagaceae bacterium ABcell3]|nr:trehalose-phosphatase [Cytophagaceae bacterium ABcell3]